MKGAFKKLGAIVAAMSMIGAPATANVPSATQTVMSGTNKDSIKEDVVPVRPMMRRNAFGGFGNQSLNAAGVFKNQRQYRKHVRSNPHLLHSKKHRSKN